MDVRIKRVYDQVSEDDGLRILVDRLWPRGISKEKAQIAVWLKDIAPSHELRKWFHQDFSNFEEFSEKYMNELANDVDKSEALQTLLELVNQEKVTMLIGSKDTQNNHAQVIIEALERLSFI